MQASTANKADTVLHCMVSVSYTIINYGLPSRVKCDKGGENVRVSVYMLSHPLRRQEGIVVEQLMQECTSREVLLQVQDHLMIFTTPHNDIRSCLQAA